MAAFQYAVSTPDTSAIRSAQMSAARSAGYTSAAGYSTAQQVAIGGGLRSADAYAAGQGGGPGNADRGPSAADRAGFPTAIPGFPIGQILGAIGGFPWEVIAAPIITGGLFYPVEAGRGSDLRNVWGMPSQPARKPKTARGRRRRVRTRTRIPNPWQPPRTRTKIPKPGAEAPGRGGTVTISRPTVRVKPPVAISSQMPRPKALMPGAGVKIKVGPIAASAPAQIPRTVFQRAGAIASIPIVRGMLGTIISQGISSLFVKAPTTKQGRITLPDAATNPFPLTNPLTALNTQGLSYARAMPATALKTAEQDCSCRPKRKKSSKKPCKNPVTSRRSFKRGARKFVTTTKEMKCQA